MAISVQDELSTVYENFDQAEREWKNRFRDLETHFDDASKEFMQHLPKGSEASTTGADSVEMGANMVVAGLALSASPAVMAVPIVVGLKKLAALGDMGEVKAPEPDLLSYQRKLKQIRTAFEDAAEYLGAEILKLKKKVTAAEIGEKEMRDTLSSIMLSPVWYPPARSVTSNPGLKRALEMRLWFAYFDQLVKLPAARLVVLPYGGGLDFSPMFERFQKLDWAPDGVEYYQGVGPNFKPRWAVKGNQYDVIHRLQRWGSTRRQLNLPHTYPGPVKSFIERVRVQKLAAEILNNPALLPTSNLTWADTSL